MVWCLGIERFAQYKNVAEFLSFAHSWMRWVGGMFYWPLNIQVFTYHGSLDAHFDCLLNEIRMRSNGSKNFRHAGRRA